MSLLLESPRTGTLTPALLAISHGTSSPIGQRAVAGLVAAVDRARSDVTVAGGFVDVQQPDVAATLETTPGPAAIVPLLLSAGYHVHVDLRRSIRDVPGAVLAAALGPDDRLVAVLERRLVEAGLRRSDRVVLACAGSSDQRAVDDCVEMGARLSRRINREVRVGFISAASPRLEDAVDLEKARGGRVVVATYLLAPGYFADLARSTAADVTTEPLLRAGDEPPRELVDLVLDRYAGALA